MYVLTIKFQKLNINLYVYSCKRVEGEKNEWLNWGEDKENTIFEKR